MAAARHHSDGRRQYSDTKQCGWLVGATPFGKTSKGKVRDDQRSMHENNELNYVSR